MEKSTKQLILAFLLLLAIMLSLGTYKVLAKAEISAKKAMLKNGHTVMEVLCVYEPLISAVSYPQACVKAGNNAQTK